MVLNPDNILIFFIFYTIDYEIIPRLVGFVANDQE